jgi:hypothetical protein
MFVSITPRRFRVTIVTMEKLINITYSECLFLHLRIQHALRMIHIIICGLPGCKIFFTSSHKTARLFKKLLLIKCVFGYPQLCL